MDEKVRIITAEVRIHGDGDLDLHHNAPLPSVAITWVSWLAGTAAIGYAVTAGERWCALFGVFMFWIAALVRSWMWRRAAWRLGAALLVATDNGRVLRPVRAKRRGNAVGAVN